MEVINLNLIPNGTNPVVHCSQYDEGREFRFNLFNGTSVLTLDGTETIECDVKKPDGNVVTVAVTNTSSDYIVVTTTLQMTACGGNSEGVVNIQKGGANLYTLNFILYCERNPLENGIQSDSAIHNLETQIANAVADQYDSNNVIFDNAPTSGHGIGYAVTSEGVKNSLDNLTVGDLADVTITTPTSGEALVFDLTDPDNPVIVNGTVSTVGSIDDLSDVDTTGKGNDYSLVYNSNDAEWQSKKLTVEVTQAEYDQLKLDGDLVEGVHYVITDGQNVTCNLGDLNDVDTTGASTGDILVKGASGWEKGDHVKDWTYCGEYNLGQNGSVNTGTWTLLQSLANRKDVLFLIRIAGGSIGNMPRISLYLPLSVFNTLSAFPDFMIATSRNYVQLDKASDTSITVSNTTIGVSGNDVYIKLYTR